MTVGFEQRAELTVFEKSGGPLTKHIRLSPDGSVKSDGSACLMASGVAHRLRLADVGLPSRRPGLIRRSRSVPCARACLKG